MSEESGCSYNAESIGNGTPLRLILETIREPPSSLRDDDDVFVILNLTNFISNLPTFLDNGGILEQREEEREGECWEDVGVL